MAGSDGSTRRSKGFGQYLAHLRTEVYEESLRDFAKRTAMSTSYLNKLELAELPTPKRETVIKMADKLGIPSGPLLVRAGFVPDEDTPEGDDDYVVMLMRTLSPGQRAAVKDFIKFVQAQGIEKISGQADDTKPRDKRGNRWAKPAGSGQ